MTALTIVTATTYRTTQPIPPSFTRTQWAVLDTVDRHGHATTGDYTDRAAGIVDGRSAQSLIRCGVLEGLSIDGRTVVRRADHIAKRED